MFVGWSANAWLASKQNRKNAATREVWIGDPHRNCAAECAIQSRRDCVLQSRVARNELPWVWPGDGDSTLKGLWPQLAGCENRRATTLSGLVGSSESVPRVARSSQLWALLRNPVGILEHNSRSDLF